MMKLYVDNREIAPPAIAMGSMEELVRHVESCALPPDSLIREIIIDGCSWAPGEIAGKPDRSPPGFTEREKIEFITGTVPEIAREAILEALSYLDRVESVTPSLAASFGLTPGPESFENLRQLYDGFHWLNMLVERLVGLFQIDMATTRVEGTALHDHHENLAGILRRLLDAQEREDFPFMADLLENEMLAYVPTWRSILRSFLGLTR